MNKRKTSGTYRSRCPVSIALDLFGDAWSLLIIRDLMFYQRRTFGEFLRAQGIASNILAQRLAQLEQAGIISKHPEPSDARKFIYSLTAKGIDLAPVLVEIIVWADRHEQTDAQPAMVRQMRSHRRAFIARTRRTWAREQQPARRRSRSA